RHGRRPRDPPARSGVGGGGYAGDRSRAGRRDQAGGARARAVRPTGHRRRHGRRGRPGGRAAGLAVRVLDHGGGGRRRRQSGARGAPGGRRAGGVRAAASGRRLGAEGTERAALSDAEGHHGSEEEGDQGREGRGSRDLAGGSRALRGEARDATSASTGAHHSRRGRRGGEGTGAIPPRGRQGDLTETARAIADVAPTSTTGEPNRKADSWRARSGAWSRTIGRATRRRSWPRCWARRRVSSGSRAVRSRRSGSPTRPLPTA